MLDTIHLVLVEFSPVCKWANPISRYAWSSCIFLHLLAWCLSRWFARDDLKRFPRWFWASCGETTIAFLSACLTLFTLSWLSLHRCVNDQIPFRDMHDLLASSCLVFESLICPWWFETLSPLILSILQWDNDSVPECMLDTIHLVLVEFAPVCKWSNPISRYAWSSCIFLLGVWVVDLPVMIWNAFPADSEHLAVRQR